MIEILPEYREAFRMATYVGCIEGAEHGANAAGDIERPKRPAPADRAVQIGDQALTVGDNQCQTCTGTNPRNLQRRS